MAANKAPSPSPAEDNNSYAYALDHAVSSLSEYASDTKNNFENGSDLAELTSQLGYIRDRADAIQSAVLGILEAQRSYL